MTLIWVKPESPSRMQKRKEKSRTQLLDLPVAQREVLKRDTTYLAKIALVLQDAPGKMLTFTQLMEKLATLISEDLRSVVSNIRVCLSSHRCFVKIPVFPGSRDSKKNYWKLDCSKITPKMVRRHFMRLLNIFPELASKVETNNANRPSEQKSTVPSPEPAACGSVQVRCEVKFTGPFSIESLLKRDSPSSLTCRISAPPSIQTWADQQLLPIHTTRVSSYYEEGSPPQTSSGLYPICLARGSTHHRGVEPTTRIAVHTEPQSYFYIRAASNLNSSLYSYITHSVAAFTPETLHF